MMIYHFNVLRLGEGCLTDAQFSHRISMAAFAKPLLCAGRFISTELNLKTMQQFFKNQIASVASMTTKERNVLLCQLSVKEHLNTIEPHEIIQLATIQAIRQANGEIDAVLKNWEENPDLDPRK
jgi:hypothetical protein